jgi:hypothetical protein
MKAWKTPIMFFVFVLCAAIFLASLYYFFPNHTAWVGWLIYGIGSILVFLVLLRRFHAEETNRRKVRIPTPDSIDAERKEPDGIRLRVRNIKGEKRGKRQQDPQ